MPGRVREIRHSTGIFALAGMLNEIQTQSGQSYAVWSALRTGFPASRQVLPVLDRSMRITHLPLLLLSLLAATPARADLHITRDHGGYVEEYKTKYQRIRDRHERVIIDGICNSACTLVFGIVPMNKICVTPRASLGFHQAYYDKAFTFGIKVTSAQGTSDLMSYYPDTVKDWIRRNGGLTTEMKKIKNGIDLWKIVDPCPEEF
jgi:hypothetical protein